MTEINQSTPKITAYVGDLEVIGNGIVPALIEAKLRLSLDDLQFEFDFVSDKDYKGSKIDRKVIEKKLSIILTNFENSLGTGIISPLEIGHHEKRRLYISFWVWTPNSNEGARIISWTMLKGSEVNSNTNQNE